MALVPPTYTDVRTYLGDPNTPWEVRHQRITSADVYRFIGTPVLLKRRYTIEDVENGVAQPAASLDYVYQQSTYADDNLSHGVGFVSIETQANEWYGVDLNDGDPTYPMVVTSDTQPEGFLPAPKYRGYGPGLLTYAILDDRPEDQWKLTQQGALIRQQTAMIQLPWWPQIGDNDIVITVALNSAGHITATYERYQLKMASPITMRGIDQQGFRETDMNAAGNRYWVGQQAELTKVPTNDIIYNVETDR